MSMGDEFVAVSKSKCVPKGKQPSVDSFTSLLSFQLDHSRGIPHWILSKAREVASEVPFGNFFQFCNMKKYVPL